MNEKIEAPVPIAQQAQPTGSAVSGPAAEAAVPATTAEPVATESGHNEPANRHAEAGRKGARRVHELMQLGLLYEKEHGLKRGRQRLRQLIQEGRLYEQEHGLATKVRRSRRDRLAGDKLVHSFFLYLLRMAKPAYRDRLKQMLQSLEEAA
jgi:hypothetical protein